MSRPARASLAVLLCMTGCAGDKPSDELVSRLEERLSKDACLRELTTFRRDYRFATRGEKVNRDLVDIEITKAGHDGLPAGKFISKPIDLNSPMVVDDRQYFAGSATYKISTGELDLWHCGMNFGGTRHMPRF